jgi:N-acetylglucosamine kinase-like BadF-type ATPase
MRYALGIDGGGSKCDAALLDESGRVVGWGRGGPTHTYYDPPEVIAASYADAIVESLAGVSGAEVWLAGGPPAGASREAVERSNRFGRHLAVTEVDTAFACAQEEWGLIVLSGTGSFVHARGPATVQPSAMDRTSPLHPRRGTDLHFGGLGPVLNDYGSAYEIGLLGLRAAFASDWTAERRTSLSATIINALGVATLRDIFNLVYVKGFSRRQIAALAQIVNSEAERADRVALQCIHRSADELAEVAGDAIRELYMESLSFPAIAIGGVAQRSRLWWERMCARLSEIAPAVRPVIPPVPPAVGGALLALREMGVVWTTDLIARTVETYRGRRRPQGVDASPE